MGWMHDTLAYFSTPPAERKEHHGKLTFSIMYAFRKTSSCRCHTMRWCI